MADQRTVLFVCPHGAAKSRMAAAFFNKAGLAGWQGTSAGTEPQEHVSQQAVRLLSGTSFEPLLDLAPPRAVADVPKPDLVVAIDCASGAIPGAIKWELEHADFDPAMRDEIHARVHALIQTLSDSDRA